MIPGFAHTIFNPGMFAYNFLVVMDFAALLGIFPVLMGDSIGALRFPMKRYGEGGGSVAYVRSRQSRG